MQTIKHREKELKTLKATQTWFYISDIHNPFENKILTEKVLNAIHYTQPYGLILGGDTLDMFSISSYAQDSSYAVKFGLSLAQEYAFGNELMDKIDSVTKNVTKKVWLNGNHEARYEKFIKSKDNAKLIGSLPSPIEALRLRERGYEVIENYPNGFYNITPEIQTTHGLYTSIHCAKAHLDKLHISSIFGHTHRFQVFTTDRYISVNCGGLFDKHSEAFEYMPRHQRLQWQNGYCIIEVADNGLYFINPIICPKDSFVLDGKLF